MRRRAIDWPREITPLSEDAGDRFENVKCGWRWLPHDNPNGRKIGLGSSLFRRLITIGVVGQNLAVDLGIAGDGGNANITGRGIAAIERDGHGSLTAIGRAYGARKNPGFLAKCARKT